MKLSAIKLEDAKNYIKVNFDDDNALINTFIEAAKSYIQNFTGLDLQKCDSISELYNVALMIVADLYENRATTDGNSNKAVNINKIYDSMLSMHCINLL